MTKKIPRVESPPGLNHPFCSLAILVRAFVYPSSDLLDNKSRSQVSSLPPTLRVPSCSSRIVGFRIVPNFQLLFSSNGANATV